MVKLPLYPAHPERVCWGCDRYCPAHDMVCGNGSERTPHPLELFGEDWVEWAAEQLGDSLELTANDVSADPIVTPPETERLQLAEPATVYPNCSPLDEGRVVARQESDHASHIVSSAHIVTLDALEP